MTLFRTERPVRELSVKETKIRDARVCAAVKKADITLEFLINKFLIEVESIPFLGKEKHDMIEETMIDLTINLSRDHHLNREDEVYDVPQPRENF